MNQVFCTRLTKLRTKSGMSQKELAVTLKVTPATLSNYENGIYLPPLSKACLLAKTLHTSLDYLTGLSDINLNAARFSRPISDRLTFFHVIKLMATLENHELLELVKYAEFLKYRRNHSTYTETPKTYLVAEDDLNSDISE